MTYLDSGVSVVMPVHNGGNYLVAAVNSIVEQQNVTFELILIDDHSTDSALRNLIDDSRIKIIKSPKRGIVAALNYGICKAQYPIIARMDSDDIAAPDRLVIQRDYLLANPAVDIVGAKVTMFSDNGSVGKGYQHYQTWINELCEPEQIAANFFIESCIPHPTAMLRKTTLDSLGYYRDTPWPEDYDLWCRAHLAGMRFGKPQDKSLLEWRDHSERTSRLDNRYSKNAFLRCKAHYVCKQLRINQHSKCRIWGTGPTGLKLHDYLQAQNFNVSGFIDVNPRLVGQLKRNKPVNVITAATKSDDLLTADGIILVAVAARGAREKIKSALLNWGLQETRDFILMA